MNSQAEDALKEIIDYCISDRLWTNSESWARKEDQPVVRRLLKIHKIALKGLVPIKLIEKSPSDIPIELRPKNKT